MRDGHYSILEDTKFPLITFILKQKSHIFCITGLNLKSGIAIISTSTRKLYCQMFTNFWVKMKKNCYRLTLCFRLYWTRSLLNERTETQKQNIAGNLTSLFSASSSAASSAASGSGCNVWQCDIDENITWRVALSSGANRISVIPSPSSASSSSSDVSGKWQI